MHKSIKNILFVIGVVMVFTAQANRPDQKDQQHASASRPAVAARTQVRPVQTRPVQTHRAAPQQVVQRQLPRVETNIPRPLDERRESSRVYAVPTPASAPAANNRLLHRQHHNNWRPRYNFYDNQYQFYPYVNVTSPVELSADYVTILFNGQTYFYDQGSFYVQDPQGYLATPPPIGIVIGVLPQDARQINVNGQVYYRYKGIFYIQVPPQGYQVVGPVQPDPDGS